MSSTSTNSSTSSSAFRVNYSNYVADITGSPKAPRHSASTGIGHHINPLHNPFPNRQNQPTQPIGEMPHYGGGSEKCARCAKTVYIAEKKVGAGRSFHTSCFSCHTCKRKLDSTGLSEHKGEIYCKSCYTKQFGAHGLISGVTMSTEQTTIRETRRPSYGQELDTPGTTNPYPHQRTYSNENVFHDEYTTKPRDVSPRQSPQKNTNTVPDQRLPTRKSIDGVNAIVDATRRRSPSPKRTDNVHVNDHGYRSSYVEDTDRSKYVHEGQKMSYGSGTSALVDIPVVVGNKPTHSTLDRFETPTEPKRDFQRSGSRSPSTTSTDSYRRQFSRERSLDPTDEYSRMNINDTNNDRNTRIYTADNSATVSGNASSTRNYSYTSTYEAKHRSTASNSSGHSRESSPSPITQQNRPPSPTAGYTSTATRNISSTYRTEASPSTTYIPQNNYRNIEHSSTTDYVDRRSPSPSSNHRGSSGLTDFVTKTNLAGNPSPSTPSNKTSTLGALVGGFRPVEKSNSDDWVD